tara:strand:- start:187 stop:729 length:543 start_codon:yes stop_codon:yes gene_type:complete
MKNEKSIFTIIGPHAGELPDSIISRKIKDIKKVGQTFWVIKAIKGKKPIEVQKFCENSEIKILFISPATMGGAEDTKSTCPNKEYSKDNLNWTRLPDISKVIGDGYAFILDSLEIKKDSYIDINKYAEESNIPLKFNQSASTICSIKSDMTSHPNRMKSNKRQLIAIGKLKAPYCVWVRK